MLKGDTVKFNIGTDDILYKLITNPYDMFGRKVVDLEGYSGEVAVAYLDKVED